MEVFHKFNKEEAFKDKLYHENLLFSVSSFKNERIKAEKLTFFVLEKSLWCFLFRLSG